MSFRTMRLFVVLWAVVGACHALSCHYSQPGKDGEREHYDLNRLMLPMPWTYLDNVDPNNITKFYIQICRPLQGVDPAICPDATASVCVTRLSNGKEEKFLPNAGKALDEPAMLENQLALVYRDGVSPECIEKGMSTRIIFQCKPGAIDSDPQLLKKISCEYLFLWETETACADRNVSSHNCSIKLRDSEHVMDLRPLKKSTFYEAKNGDKTYLLNICGVINGDRCGNTTSCEVVADKPTIFGLANNMTLRYVDDSLRLQYVAGVVSSTVDFECDTSVAEPKLEYVSSSETKLEFKMKTPLACVPKPMDCEVFDSKGNRYDLSPLGRTLKNWEVGDARSDHPDLRYHINVCRALNTVSDYQCPGGQIGGCQTSTTHNSSFNLGYLQGKPTVNPDGTIALRYMGGSECRGKKHMRSTLINFYCSQLEKSPGFQDETDDCIYIFNWHTPSACPVKAVFGKDCLVTDPLYGYQFDLNPLRGAKDYVVSSHKTDSYHLNICGPLKTPCGDYTQSGACLFSPGSKPMSIGNQSDRPIYDDGSLTMMMTRSNKDCPQEKQLARVIFLCDHAVSDSESKPEFVNRGDKCDHYFVWKTRRACPPYKEVSCKATDPENGHQYDLSGLSWTAANHKAEVGKKEFVINVCRSLVHSKDSRCEYDSGVCMVEYDEVKQEKNYTNLGDSTKGPYVENGRLRLKYDTGDICMDPKVPNKPNIETIIDFMCSSQGSEPQFLKDENCLYRFLWETPAACPLALDPDNPYVSGDCTITDTRTNHKFNMSSLRNENGVTITGAVNLYAFTVSVCGPLKGSPCGDVGSCQLNKSSGAYSSGGKANSRLRFEDGILSLRYEEGEACPGFPAVNHSTLIQFICSREGSPWQGPRLVSDADACTHMIHWDTPLACEVDVQSQCMASRKGKQVDLSPLVREVGNYEASGKDTSYLINVCHEVSPDEKVACPAGAAVCSFKARDGGYSDVMSLGYVSSKPTLNEDGSVTIKYAGGSDCSTSKDVKASSTVNFVCSELHYPGSPTLSGVGDNCDHTFEWKTRVVCPLQELRQAGPGRCVYHGEGFQVDLSALHQPGGHEVKSAERNFRLNLCQSDAQCGGACEKTSKGVKSYGRRVQSDFYGNTMSIAYEGGDVCSKKENYGAKLLIKCNATAGKGSPSLLLMYPCYVVFQWETDVVCDISTPGAAPHTSEASSPIAGALAAVIISVGLVGMVMLVLWNPDRRRRINMWAKNLLGLGSRDTVHYSKINTDDPDSEAALLLGTSESQPPLIQVDSDDELLT